jgi:hypothetical protein
MKQVSTSSLGDIKTVFDNPDTNVYHYNELKTKFNENDFGVELAEPRIRQANNLIVWRSKAESTLLPLTDLSSEEQKEVAAIIQNAFSTFKSKTSEAVTDKFHAGIMEIPNLSSVLVGRKGDGYEIVITEWGFVNDTLERKTGILSQIFPTPKVSILAVLKKSSGQLIESEKVQLRYEGTRTNDITDEQGRARLGHLALDSRFTLLSPDGKFHSEEFTADGRKEYPIIMEEAQEEEPPKDEVEEVKKAPEVKEEPEEEKNEEPEKEPEEKDPPPVVPVQLQFINYFGKPIKRKQIALTAPNGNRSDYTTDENGCFDVVDMPDGSYGLRFQRAGEEWNKSFDHENRYNKHKFQVTAKVPWYWWLLCAFLLYLLICCLFFNCMCEVAQTIPPADPRDADEQAINSVEEEMEIVEPEVIIPCNVQQKSGGAGITRNHHELGSSPGLVRLAYDMQNIPDKLEIYYAGSLVASTRDVLFNEDGYVGGNTNAGCCGELVFQYTPSGTTYCEVVVSGFDSTQWGYSLGCPE